MSQVSHLHAGETLVELNKMFSDGREANSHQTSFNSVYILFLFFFFYSHRYFKLGLLH